MFAEFFRKRKLRKLQDQLKAAHPEVFDESGNTYNAGNFMPDFDALVIENEDVMPFSELHEVFENVGENERKYFLPLISFGLNKINPNWTGMAHFIYYQKSQSEQIESRHFINQYGDYNCTIFQVIGNKIRYSGAMEVFWFDKEEESSWQEAIESYSAAKSLKHTIQFHDLIFQVNSRPKWIQSDERPKPVDDENIYFIGQLNVSSLIDAEGWIFLFYCPEKSIFIQVEQWT